MTDKPKVKESSKPHIGRKKGTPNKRTQDVMEKLEALNCDPIKGMADIAIEAMKDGEGKDLSLAGQMYKELAQYIAPKRKAIEHSGSLQVSDMTREEMDRRIEELEALKDESS